VPQQAHIPLTLHHFAQAYIKPNHHIACTHMSGQNNIKVHIVISQLPPPTRTISSYEPFPGKTYSYVSNISHAQT